MPTNPVKNPHRETCNGDGQETNNNNNNNTTNTGPWLSGNLPSNTRLWPSSSSDISHNIVTFDGTSTSSFDDENDVDENSATDDDDDDSLLGDLDPDEWVEILEQGDDDDDDSPPASATTATTSPPTPTDLPPGIPIPERKKSKEQHRRQCINVGRSRYKKKLQKTANVRPTISRQLGAEPFMDPSYKKFFGMQEGKGGGKLDEAELLKAFSGVTPDPHHLIYETIQYHKKALEELLQLVCPKFKLDKDEHKKILTKSLEMILEWYQHEDVSVSWTDASKHTKEDIPKETFTLPNKVTFKYVFKGRGVWSRVEGHHGVPICVSGDLYKVILVKLPIHCAWHLLLVLIIPQLRGWKIAAGGLCYRARKEAIQLGYDFDKCLAEFSQDLFGSDVCCLCVWCVTMCESVLAYDLTCS